jgi:carbonic anhydrase/acetyltransferase-like protein (isoleucine patch superfamily)
MAIYQLEDLIPQVDDSAYVADEATVIGDVRLGPNTSVWHHAAIRGDNEPITIGEGSNVQEGAVLHVDPGFPLTIGKDVTVGHQAMLHGCTVGDGALIGIQAVVLNGAVIGRNCLVAAGAVVTEGKSFPDNSLIVGAPAKAIREVTPEVAERMRVGSQDYAKRSQRYKTGLKRLD